MVQEWIEIDESIDLELFFRSDDQQLRWVALFDSVINNTDRKIGHLLPDKSGHLFVCDHGVTFHEDDKLRTVLWQWADQELATSEIAALTNLSSLLDSNAIPELPELITEDEIVALRSRISQLLSSGKFPVPNPEWPHIPWPPF
jgi:uncharacterized repeat protein (TIGR03843 family)